MIAVKSMPKRTLALFLVAAILLTMIPAVLLMNMSSQPTQAYANPPITSELNQSVVVQEINLLPVETKYNAGTKDAPVYKDSRTSLSVGTNSKDSHKYSSITVNADDSVDFTITQDTTINQTANNSTAFVESFTMINQRINLAENPWLMLRWSGSGRCNGRIYFSITKKGTEYGRGGTVLSANHENSLTLQQMITGDGGNSYYFSVPLSNIVNKNTVGYHYTNHTQTDFNAGTVADYTIDLYEYLKSQSAYASYFPSGEDWKDSTNNYITIYAVCHIIASESNKPLTKGTTVHWEKFSVGRHVLNRPASILPTNVEFMNITDTTGQNGVDYGRVSKMDDGSVTFLNTSSSKSVQFNWKLRRYFNAAELEALYIDGTYSGMTSDDIKLNTWIGGRTVTYKEPTKYNYRGTKPWLNDLIKYYASTNNVTNKEETSGVYNAVVDFRRYLANKNVELATDAKYIGTEYAEFYPDDCLIFVNDITLEIPAGGKLTFTCLEFQMKNDNIPATEPDSVYPWASADAANGLPPEGTPVYSTVLDGAAGTAYDWAADAKDAPIVKTKVDLLAMKTYFWNKWSDSEIRKSDNDAEAGIPYERHTDGSSVYQTYFEGYNKNPTVASYYQIMRYGPSDQWNRNYYTYLDVNPVNSSGGKNHNATQYLYYSYELIDQNTGDNIEPMAGFYFHFANARRDKFNHYNKETGETEIRYSYQYYLDHSGIGLNECSGMFNLGYVGGNYAYGAEALMSPMTARTGCIDVSSLWVKGKSDSAVANGQYLQLEALRIYLTPNTKIKINYFFFGGESLSKEVTTNGTIPREGGQSFPWDVSKADFDKFTDPDSADKKFTFGNKVDLIKDIRDRVKVHNAVVDDNIAAGNPDPGTKFNSEFPSGTLDPVTGAVTVKVTANGAGADVNKDFIKIGGISYDHIWRTQVANDGDFAGMRYLNYSVSAPAGMRWSIMFCEHDGSSSDQRAIMTWCDSDARWNDDKIETSAPAGKTYFRMAACTGYPNDSTPEYNTYWENHNNTSWRIYSIPGSQTGCIDMRQVAKDFEWNNIISIYFVAYQDPNLVLDGVEPSVTFNYLYMTSTPIESANVSQPATKPGTIYNWGSNAVSAPVVDSATKRTFSYSNAENWGSTYPLNYKLSSSTVDLTATPYLYYSYRLVEKNNTSKIVKLPATDSVVSMWVIEQNTYYYARTTSGVDSNKTSVVGEPAWDKRGTNTGYGKPSFIRRSTNNDNQDGSTYTRTHYYGYAAETGCINLAEYFTDDTTALNQIRFVVNNSLYQTGKYQLIVDYLFLGKAASSGASFTQSWTPLNLPKAPTASSFHENLIDPLPSDPVSSGTITSGKVVDLDRTPYLFYSMEYEAGDRGTFGLQTQKRVSTTPDTYQDIGTFHRDASRVDDVLITSGAPTSTTKYMLQSETGCIDLRSWYIDNEVFGENEPKIIKVSSVNFWGDNVTINYLYFGAKSDKTIDLIPETARGRLDNGLPTKAWVVKGQGGYDAELKSSIATSGDLKGFHEYDAASKGISSFTPSMQVLFQKDATNDGFNDLRIVDSSWGQFYLRYGYINNKGTRNTFEYCSSGNNQMTGLMIDLNETPYLHFSFDQDPNSRTAMVLQTTDNTTTQAMNGRPASETRPWLSGYTPTSPAGQLLVVHAGTNICTFYKDTPETDDDWASVYGSQGGVIDLRSWYSETNGYVKTVSLDSIRFYTYNTNGTPTDLKIKHLYLSSSASAAYAVTFHKNDKTDGTDDKYIQHVIQNANQQFVDDTAVSHFKFRDEDGNGKADYTFLGWYTDPSCEEYFDIKGTPLTGNLHLYARWIDNDDIKNDNEVNLIEYMKFDERSLGKDQWGEAAIDNEKITIDAGSDLTMTIPVGIAYPVKTLRSMFVGFDTDKTCEGFDIIVNVKCASSQNYSLIQDAFSADFLTDKNLLTAAPYDREMALYTYLGVRDDLPTRENEQGLIEINSVTIVVPAGVSAELRYLKAGKEMSLLGNADVRAPATTVSFDLLHNPNVKDTSFVKTGDRVVYSTLEGKAATYLNKYYTQAALHGIADSYVHLGGLYNYSIDMKKIAAGNTDQGRYLYISIDQPEDSYFTFALYTAFNGMVEGDTAGKRDKAVYDVYTQKSVSYYSAKDGALMAKDYDTATEGFIPVETAYINGETVLKLDLYTWYKDALKPYRSNSQVDTVKLLGIRLFSDDRSTDTTLNYMFIGNDETELSKGTYSIFAEYPYMAGSEKQGYTDAQKAEALKHRYQFGNYKRGETIYTALDQLTSSIADYAPIDDPNAKFVGWVFRDIAYSCLPTNKQNTIGLGYSDLSPYLVLWNPDATNGNMYHPDTNPGGSWYVKNRPNDTSHNINYPALDPRIPSNFETCVKSVFYTFATDRGNTQVIVPVFLAENNMPQVKVEVAGGSGTVSVVAGNASSVGTNTWKTSYAADIVLRASGNGFLGWYDASGTLVSSKTDCEITVVDDTVLTARFAMVDGLDTTLEHTQPAGNTIVWLQSTTGTAGTDFYLASVNTGNNGTTQKKLSKSNINDTTGTKQIACYWNLDDMQVVTAVAPSGYHWEQLLSDGKRQIRVSEAETYTFVVSTNIKLVAVANGSEAFESTVVHNEYAFDDDRSDAQLRFSGQVVCAEGDEVLTCGIVFRKFMNHKELPSIGCENSSTVTASAWNSTTGQFTVEFSLGEQYVVRSYAVIRNIETGIMSIVYGDLVSNVF